MDFELFFQDLAPRIEYILGNILDVFHISWIIILWGFITSSIYEECLFYEMLDFN